MPGFFMPASVGAITTAYMALLRRSDNSGRQPASGGSFIATIGLTP